MNFNDDNELFEHLMDLVNNDPKRFCVIETRVDVDTQLDYFQLSSKLRKSHTALSVPNLIAKLTEQSDENEIRETLVYLAASGEVEAYRAIESYLETVPELLRPWTMLAYQEARLMLETSLLDESRVYISSPMGGKDYRLRYSLALVSVENHEMSAFQQELILKETQYLLSKSDAEFEDITHGNGYAIITCLIPIHLSINEVISPIVLEINQYGNFLEENFIITNEKPLSEADIIRFRSRNSEQ